MTARHSVRDVKNTFEKILDDNTHTLRDLDETLRQTREHIETVQDLYTRSLDKFITAQLRPINSAMLKTLSGLAGLRDFEREYNDNLSAARAAEIRLNGLVTTHGEPKTLKDKLQALSDESNIVGGESIRLSENIGRLKKTLGPVDAFNAKAEEGGKPQLAAESIDYFSSKKGFAHVWGWLFDSHYRQGRALIRDFAEKGATIPDTQAKRAEAITAQAGKKARLDEMVAEAARIEPVLKTMRETGEQAVSEQTVREQLKKEIFKTFDDTKFFNRAAKALGDAFPVFVTEQRAKLENLRKVEAATLASKEAVKQAGGKLDVHMSKLRKAASRAGSKQMTIDLDGIKTGFAGMQTGVKAQSAQLRQTGAAVRDYKFSPSSTPAASPSDPLFFMAVIMMSDINHGVAVPDVSVAGNIGDSFNSAALDGLNKIDMADIHVAVPEISVSVPDISVPDVSSGSYGGGYSGGGYDGGGFSGGFDGGGF